MLDKFKEGVQNAIELLESMKDAIDILNNMDDVEVASPFWVNTMEMLEKDAKKM